MEKQSLNKSVPLDKLKDGLFYAGKQWDDQISAKQIEDIMDFFEAVNWKVVYDPNR